MNAAARLVQQNILTRHLVLTYILTRRQMVMLGLTVCILMTAIYMIYTTQSYRSLYADYQRNVGEITFLRNQHSQLLLERSNLMRQSRVQLYAERNLRMVMPERASVVIIRE